MKLVYVGKEKDYDERDFFDIYNGQGVMMPEVYVDFETGSIYVETIYGDLKPVDCLKNKVVYVGSCTDSHNVFQTHIDDNDEDDTNDKNDTFPFCYGLY